MLTLVEVARKVAPKAKQEYIDGLGGSEQTFLDYGLTTPLRRCNFLAQVMGETGLTVLQESGAYTRAGINKIFGVGRHSAAISDAEAVRIAALPVAKRGPVLFERVYGQGNPKKARELGNDRPGDGWNFRGIGPLQSTGRRAARVWGERCKADFEGDVLLMLLPQWIMLPPLLEWDANNLNALADQDDVRRIRRIINGGYNGIDAVEEWHDRLWKIMRTDVAGADEQESWQAAAPASETYVLQENLNQLGYTPALVTDGKYGPKTKKAVMWFQKIAGLKVDGVAGPITNAAITERLEGFHIALQVAA